MFDLINGLPVHPFVVHFVVVLVPLAALGTIAIVVRPQWRERFGYLVVGCAALATILIPVATESGEALEGHVGDVGRHAQLGQQLIWFAVPLLVLDIVLVWLARRERTTGRRSSPTMGTVAALCAVAALAICVQVYRIGDAGARAVWADQVTTTITEGGTAPAATDGDKAANGGKAQNGGDKPANGGDRASAPADSGQAPTPARPAGGTARSHT